MTRDLNYRLGIDGKDASKSLRDTGSEAKKLSKELGEAKVSGDTVAKAIRQVADTASADLKKAQSAAKALGTALGPELVAELEQAGGSMLGLTQDMKRLAGSYEEVEANAEALADAIRHANAVQKEMGSASLNSAGSLDNLTRSGDQTRSVMANLTGNASQDLAQLAGVSGTAGVAIGQLAEYAADGNINMGNLTKLAGPMVALGVAGWGVSEVIGNIREKAALAKEQTELWLDVQRQLNAALAGDDVDLGATAASLNKQYDGTLDLLEKLGYGSGDFIEAMRGQGTMIADLREELGGLQEKLAAAQSGSESLTQAELDRYNLLSQLVPNLKAYAEQQGNAITQYDEETRRVSELTAALNAEVAALDNGISASSRRAAGYEAEARSQEIAQRRKIASVEEWLSKIEGIPEEKITEISAQIDKGDYAEVDRLLGQLVRDRVAAVFVSLNTSERGKGAAQGTGAKSNKTGVTFGGSASSGGGGGSSGGGGGGGGSAAPTDPMAEWDKAVSNLFDVGGLSEGEYRKYIEMRMSSFKEYEDEYVRFFNELEGLNDRAAAAEKKRADEVQKALDDETKARQRAADDAARIAKEAEDESFRVEMAKFELGEKSVADQRAWLDTMIAAEVKYSEEYMRLIRLRNNLPTDQVGSTASSRDQTGPVTVIQNFPPGVSPTSVSVATRDYTRRGGR